MSSRTASLIFRLPASRVTVITLTLIHLLNFHYRHLSYHSSLYAIVMQFFYYSSIHMIEMLELDVLETAKIPTTSQWLACHIRHADTSRAA